MIDMGDDGKIADMAEIGHLKSKQGKPKLALLRRKIGVAAGKINRIKKCYISASYDFGE